MAVILVTGATSGIGRDAALRLARAGHRFAADPAAVSRHRAGGDHAPAGGPLRGPGRYRLLLAALAASPRGVADAAKRRVMGW